MGIRAILSGWLVAVLIAMSLSAPACRVHCGSAMGQGERADCCGHPSGMRMSGPACDAQCGLVAAAPALGWVSGYAVPAIARGGVVDVSAVVQSTGVGKVVPAERVTVVRRRARLRV